MGDTSAAQVMGRGCREAESTPGRGINRSNFTEPGSETKMISEFRDCHRVERLEGEIKVKFCNGRRESWTVL